VDGPPTVSTVSPGEAVKTAGYISGYILVTSLKRGANEMMNPAPQRAFGTPHFLTLKLEASNLTTIWASAQGLKR
jgi:hypothetical protein